MTAVKLPSGEPARSRGSAETWASREPSAEQGTSGGSATPIMPGSDPISLTLITTSASEAMAGILLCRLVGSLRDFRYGWGHIYPLAEAVTP